MKFSSQNWSQTIRLLKLAWKMQPAYRKIFFFALAGGTGFLLDVFIMEVLRRGLEITPQIARVPGFLLVTVYTWYINRTWAFRTPHPASLAEFGKYLSGASVGIGVNWLVFLLMLKMGGLFSLFPPAAVAVASAVSMIVNFLIYERIFRR